MKNRKSGRDEGDQAEPQGLAQDAGIKAMADIAAADIAICKRTEPACGPAGTEAADLAKPPEPRPRKSSRQEKENDLNDQ